MPLFAAVLWTVIWFVFRMQELTGDVDPEVVSTDLPSNRKEDVTRQVRGPGIGLVLTGILNWIGIPASVLLIHRNFSDELPPEAVVGSIAVAALIAAGVMIAAGLMMMRCRGRKLTTIGAVLAMLVSPGNLVGLPVGIWSLVALSQREVKAAFRKSESE